MLQCVFIWVIFSLKSTLALSHMNAMGAVTRQNRMSVFLNRFSKKRRGSLWYKVDLNLSKAVMCLCGTSDGHMVGG